MWQTNKVVGALVALGLSGVLASIVLSDWAKERVSDGFALGSFPIAYLLLSIGLIATTCIDRYRDESLEAIRAFNLPGVARIACFAIAALCFAFLQHHAGLIACTFALGAVAAIMMGQRGALGLLAFAAGATALVFCLFFVFGLSLRALPSG